VPDTGRAPDRDDERPGRDGYGMPPENNDATAVIVGSLVGLDVETNRAKILARIDGEQRAKVAAFMARPRCTVCGRQMITNSGRHFLCDPSTIVGRACTCPIGCTDRHVGDSVTVACDPNCQPCRINRGQPARMRDK
jgi:hypothetical protein